MNLVLVLIISFSAFAQLSTSVEVSKKMEQGSTETIVKKALLFEASLKAAGKLASEMGFSQETFDQKLTEKFAEYFNLYKERKLNEKFGANYKETLGENERKDFLNAMEDTRQEEFFKFVRTHEAVKSLSYKSLTADQVDPTLWRAKIDLEMDRGKLLRVYNRIISGEAKPYNKIIIFPEIHLNEMGWGELGLESGESFLAPVRHSWNKWLETNLPDSVEESFQCVEDCPLFWGKWMEMKQDTALSSVPYEYANSVWLKIDINLRKTESAPHLSQLGLEWSGRVVLLDVNTKRILNSFELGIEKRTFRGQDQKAINSALASAIYTSPLGAFVQISKVLQEKTGLNRVSRLVIKGHRNIGDAILLVEKLKTRGASLGLEVQLDAMAKDEAQVVCFYKGEEKSFTDLLSGLKELKSTHSYTLVNEFTGVHHVLKLVTE